ncbi:hypothetical protein AA14337_3190 [Acetobacter malorum DSM 14337]|uniref:Leucine-rich repeat domain-containing protein n=1 Tax=Acetobacter malorum DSM 14337 TaxID=1307910 RepID=A0ABQ0Q056_9PROT|nr:hypothetical protein [Acetobacter malorum]KXV05770.1 hypothetical protein AD930_11655 [Acetobacter malorum]GBQ85895.1 hypothetical protein AA14337_3190 [Acetobacter malorum DSM 14337]
MTHSGIFETTEQLKAAYPLSFRGYGDTVTPDGKIIPEGHVQPLAPGDPKPLYWRMSFILPDNTEINSLPSQMDVDGYMDLNGCTSLKKLPDELKVGIDLYLSGCKSLTALPPRLIVDRNLDLSGCSSLRALTDTLSLCGYLDLSGCRSLSSLPALLLVREDLGLQDCSALKELPRDLFVGGQLILTGCEGIKIPQEVIERMDGRIVYPSTYDVIPKKEPVSLEPGPNA